MKAFFSATLAGLALVACTNSAVADTNLLESDNYSFEDPVIATDPSAISGEYVITNSIPDWTFTGAGSGSEATGIQTISSAFDNTGTSDGLNYALLNIQQNGPGIITYTGSGADALPVIAADTDYTLTVAVGNRTSGSSGIGGTDTVDLLVGTSAFGATVNETQITADTFTDETFTLTATMILADNLVGQPLGIQLIGSQYGSDGFDQAAFDNVRLTATTVAAPVIGTLYYDTNGATAGTTTSSTQNFTDSVWTTDSAGSSATTGYTSSSNVIFSAGSNGTGTQAVTFTDTELVHSFTFNNGEVTLYGSGSPGLHLEAGGITVNSNDGATTLDSTLGTITLDASQSWNNDSTQALNVNSGVTAAGHTLTFAGTGTGAVNLNGALSGNLDLTMTSPTGTVNVENAGNTFAGTITIDGGVMNFANIASLGNSGNAIDLGNGATVSFDTTEGYSAYSNNINLTGTGQFSSGVYGSNGADIYYSGTINGGPTSELNLVEGDFIPTSTVAGGQTSDIGTINVTGGRMLAYGDGIFGNNATVNVGAGAILDFQLNETLNNTITLAEGSSLEARSDSVTLNNVLFPTLAPSGTGTITLGADDQGFGTITINGPGITLGPGSTQTFVLNADSQYTEFTATDEDPSNPTYFYNTFENSGNATSTVNLGEKITGSGNLILTSESEPVINYNTGHLVGYRLGAGSPISLDGANDYSGTTTIDGVTVYPGTSGFGTSTVTLNGGNAPYAEDVATIELTGGNLSNNFIAATGNNVMNLVSATDQTLSGSIEVDGGAGLSIANYTSANLTVGSIDMKVSTYDQAVTFDAYGTGNITFDGTYTSPANIAPQNSGLGASTLFLGYFSKNNAADYYIAPGANMAAFEPYDINGKGAIWMFAGNLYLQNSSFVLGQVIALDGATNSGNDESVNIVGAQEINAEIYSNSINQFTVAQTTPDETIWAGNIQDDYTGMILSAVDGSRLDITGEVAGGTPYAVIKTGAGTVEFSSPYGADLANNSSVVVDIQQGTFLVENTLGGNYGLGNNGGTVNVEKGATFGGNASLTSAQTIVSENAGSILAPGDAGQTSLGIKPSIGTMTLPGGIVTASNADSTTDGLTFDFKLNGDSNNGGELANEPGVNNDVIYVGNMTLNGTITINLTALGTTPLRTGYGNFFILIVGGGDWTGSPTFDVIAPAGYALDPTFGQRDSLGDGNKLGYAYTTTPGDGTFAVQLIAVPEPSTCGLLGLGLLAIAAIGRVDWRKAITGRNRS